MRKSEGEDEGKGEGSLYIESESLKSVSAQPLRERAEERTERRSALGARSRLASLRTPQIYPTAIYDYTSDLSLSLWLEYEPLAQIRTVVEQQDGRGDGGLFGGGGRRVSSRGLVAR